MANSAEVKGDSLPDLDDLLQCPVCYEIPTGQIFQCNEGHHVCGRCKSRLDQCPVCRALFFGTRNYAMEELIANVRKLQAFKLGGKMTVTSNGSESTTSADNLVAGANLNGSVEEEGDNNSNTTTMQALPACKGLFRCLCCKGVSERLPSARLLNHLRYFHAANLIEGKSEGGEYVQAWQITTEPRRIAIAIRVSDMGVFFLVIEINKTKIQSWVSMAASPQLAEEFCYSITISGSDREAIFTDRVWSVRSCEGTLKKRGRCLMVDGEDVRALCSTASVGGRLSLRRAPSDPAWPLSAPRAVLRVASRGTAVVNEPATPPEPQRSPSPPATPPLQILEGEAVTASFLRSQNDRLHREFASLVEAGAFDDNSGLQMSRNARRRMRRRLRAALEPIQPADHFNFAAQRPRPAPPRPAPGGTSNAHPQSDPPTRNNTKTRRHRR